MSSAPQPSLGEIAREWGRIGCIGFGGPPAHIALLGELFVERGGWLSAHEFEDAIAACNLLPGPASTQLAIFCAWRVRGRSGALIGGLGFIAPDLLAILCLSVLFLADSPPVWVRGAGAGATRRITPGQRARNPKSAVGPHLQPSRRIWPVASSWHALPL